MNWLLFVVTSLAVFRVADVLAEDEGPFSVFRKVRRKVPASTNAGRGIRCPFCIGIYLSAAATSWLWYCGFVPVNLTALYGFGLSGAAAVWKSVTK